MTEPQPRDFKAEAFRLGLVLCLLSVPLSVVLIPASMMVSDAGDTQNPALVAFVFTAMIYPLVALVGGVVALVIRRRERGARPWLCLVLPLINIAAGFLAIATI